MSYYIGWILIGLFVIILLVGAVWAFEDDLWELFGIIVGSVIMAAMLAGGLHLIGA